MEKLRFSITKKEPGALEVLVKENHSRETGHPPIDRLRGINITYTLSRCACILCI